MAKKGEITPYSVRKKISKANKGNIVSEETKQKLSIISKKLWQDPEYRQKTLPKLREVAKARRGKPLSDETKRKISLKNRGRKLSEEWKKKLSESHMGLMVGEKHPLYGKPRSDRVKKILSQKNRGRKHTIEARRKISLAQIGRPSGMLGKHHTKETKEKIGQAQTGKSFITEKGRQKLREKRLHQIFPQKDTKIELKLQEALNYENIQYQTHKPIFGQPDIFIEPNICIFADGEYWHNKPKAIERDLVVNKHLISNGYTVLRFREHEINQEIKKCISKIKHFFNDLVIKHIE